MSYAYHSPPFFVFCSLNPDYVNMHHICHTGQTMSLYLEPKPSQALGIFLKPTYHTFKTYNPVQSEPVEETVQDGSTEQWPIVERCSKNIVTFVLKESYTL